MTLKPLKSIAKDADKAMLAGGTIAATGMAAAQLNPAVTHIGNGVALVGLTLAAIALFAGMATSLSNAD